jgi:hypothetical protein
MASDETIVENEFVCADHGCWKRRNAFGRKVRAEGKPKPRRLRPCNRSTCSRCGRRHVTGATCPTGARLKLDSKEAIDLELRGLWRIAEAARELTREWNAERTSGAFVPIDPAAVRRELLLALNETVLDYEASGLPMGERLRKTQKLQ